MGLRPDELAKTIDHTLPDPEAGRLDVDLLCEEAREHHFASVCVFPAHVRQAVGLLRGCDVKTCAVIGFPLGEGEGRAKIRTAQTCVAEGAEELEFVPNLPAMLAGDFRLVRDELVALVRVVRMKSVNVGKDVSVKVVLEAGVLDDKLMRLACGIVERAGADFASTSAGFSPDGATVQDVELLRECLSENVGVKAVGGIETLEDVLAFVNAGAGRIGMHAAVAVMQGFAVREPV